MSEIHLHTSQISEMAPTLSAGDRGYCFLVQFIQRETLLISASLPCWMKTKNCLSP